MSFAFGRKDGRHDQSESRFRCLSEAKRGRVADSRNFRRKFVDLVVEEEVTVGGEVGPAIGVEDGAVHGYFAFRSKSVSILLIPAAFGVFRSHRPDAQRDCGCNPIRKLAALDLLPVCARPDSAELKLASTIIGSQSESVANYLERSLSIKKRLHFRYVVINR